MINFDCKILLYYTKLRIEYEIKIHESKMSIINFLLEDENNRHNTLIQKLNVGKEEIEIGDLINPKKKDNKRHPKQIIDIPDNN